MPDFYPHELVRQAVFIEEFGTNIDQGTTDMGLPKDTFAVARTEALTYTNLYDRLDKADKLAAELRRQFTLQQAATEKAVREAAKQIKGTINVPKSVLTLLNLNNTGEAPSIKWPPRSPC